MPSAEALLQNQSLAEPSTALAARCWETWSWQTVATAAQQAQGCGHSLLVQACCAQQPGGCACRYGNVGAATVDRTRGSVMRAGMLQLTLRCAAPPAMHTKRLPGAQTILLPPIHMILMRRDSDLLSFMLHTLFSWLPLHADEEACSSMRLASACLLSSLRHMQ